jgi:hypothetical protein
MKWLKYIIAGLLFMAPGEFLINGLIYGNHLDFLLSLGIYILLLLVTYFIWEITVKFPKKNVLLTLGIIYGIFGLMAEWFLLANAPWINPGANQLGMFAWWSSIFVLSRLFTEDGFLTVKTVTITYYIIFSTLILWIGLTAAPLFAVVIMGYGLIPFLFYDAWYIYLSFKKAS